MAGLYNRQNDVILAGKVVEVGTAVSASKTALQTVNANINKMDNSLLYDRVNGLLEGGISADERAEFLSSWEIIDSGYTSLARRVDENGLSGEPLWQTVVNYRASLMESINRIREQANPVIDMAELQKLVNAYLNAKNSFSETVDRVSSAYNGWSVETMCTPSAPVGDEPVYLSFVVKDSEGVDISAYDSTTYSYILDNNPQWILTSTADDSLFTEVYGNNVEISGELRKKLYDSKDTPFRMQVVVTLPTPS